MSSWKHPFSEVLHRPVSDGQPATSRASAEHKVAGEDPTARKATPSRPRKQYSQQGIGPALLIELPSGGRGHLRSAARLVLDSWLSYQLQDGDLVFAVHRIHQFELSASSHGSRSQVQRVVFPSVRDNLQRWVMLNLAVMLPRSDLPAVS